MIVSTSLKSQNKIDYSPQRFITIGEYEYHYTDSGTGKEVILFLHGFGQSSFSFSQLKDHFDRSKFRLITIDLKGNGYSAKPANSDYSIRAQSEIVTEFLYQLEIKYFNIIMLANIYGISSTYLRI